MFDLIGITIFLFSSVFSFSTPTPSINGNIDNANGSDVLSQEREVPLTDCIGVRSVSESECNLLVVLYNQTNGEQWSNSENWLLVNDNVSPCDWYGITCDEGHVTQINLANNRLRGELSAAVIGFPSLTHLDVNNNQLRGSVPLAICGFVDRFVSIDISYNQLTAANERVNLCLNEMNPQWFATQTIPPTNLRPSLMTTDTIQLSWTPIEYTVDGAYYEVSYALEADGPFLVHGVTLGTATSTFLLDGLASGTSYIIRVRTYTPAHRLQQEEQWSAYTTLAVVTESTADDVLLLVYFPADNDLSPYVNGVIRRLQGGTILNPTVRVVMLADGAEDNDTQLLSIADGVVTPASSIQRNWVSNELDTTDPTVLAQFLKIGRELYPASRTIVSIMGHGVGLSPEFAWLVSSAPGEEPVPQSGIPALPKGMDFTPGDITNNGGFLSTLDLAYALNEATDNGANPFDLVFFDQCFQGNLDVLYEMRNTADVFVGSGNYAWLSAPYHRYLPRFTPSSTPKEMASAIIRIYQNSLNEHHPNAIFTTTSREIEAVANAVSRLGEALLDATNAGQSDLILQASLNGKYIDTTQCGRQNLILGPPDELMGAGAFANNLLRTFPGDSEVAAAANDLLIELENIEGNSQSGRPHIAPQTIWDFDDTFTILAPLRRDAPAELVWRASIYTEEAPLTAKWSALPTQTVTITNTFAFVRDKQWDEFIDVWYTNELAPTVGDWCQYTPPVIVSDVVTESLSLDVNVVGDEVSLTWDQTGQDNAVEYWLMARQGDGNWRTLAAIDLTQTSYKFIPPTSDQPYDFMVVAQNEDGLAVAQSDERSLLINDAPDPNESEPVELYLPLIAVE